MDAVIAVDYDKDHTSFCENVKAFNAKHATTTTFVNEYGLAKKEQFVKHLLSALHKISKEHSAAINEGII
jgi:hypothetical protein